MLIIYSNNTDTNYLKAKAVLRLSDEGNEIKTILKLPVEYKPLEAIKETTLQSHLIDKVLSKGFAVDWQSESGSFYYI